jgi:hypothetical protein
VNCQLSDAQAIYELQGSLLVTISSSQAQLDTIADSYCVSELLALAPALQKLSIGILAPDYNLIGTAAMTGIDSSLRPLLRRSKDSTGAGSRLDLTPLQLGFMNFAGAGASIPALLIWKSLQVIHLIDCAYVRGLFQALTPLNLSQRSFVQGTARVSQMIHIDYPAELDRNVAAAAEFLNIQRSLRRLRIYHCHFLLLDKAPAFAALHPSASSLKVLEFVDGDYLSSPSSWGACQGRNTQDVDILLGLYPKLQHLALTFTEPDLLTKQRGGNDLFFV